MTGERLAEAHAELRLITHEPLPVLAFRHGEVTEHLRVHRFDIRNLTAHVRAHTLLRVLVDRGVAEAARREALLRARRVLRATVLRVLDRVRLALRECLASGLVLLGKVRKRLRVRRQSRAVALTQRRFLAGVTRA